MPLEVVHPLARIKAAAARVNAELGIIDRQSSRGRTRCRAWTWPPATTTTSSRSTCSRPAPGTSTNMNVNEVVASLASEPLGHDVHPNDSGQREPEQQRHVPVGGPRRRRRRPHRRPVARDGRTGRRACTSLAAEHTQTVKAGRTHLMDATPITFGQEVQRLGHAGRARRGARTVRPASAVRPAPGRDRRRDRGQRPRRLCADRSSRSCRRDGRAVHRGARPRRGPVGAGLARRDVRAAAGARGVTHQDLQRPAADELRADGGARRDPAARPAAWLVDHARQGQSRCPRGGSPGLRPGRRATTRRSRGLPHQGSSSST